jgi:hypothetical protein
MQYLRNAAYTESFAHPLVEEMANGLPVVAAEIAIHREICQEAAVYFTTDFGRQSCGHDSLLRRYLTVSRVEDDFGHKTFPGKDTLRS